MYSFGNFSAYSFHESVLRVEELVVRARELGYRWVGLSDYGGFWGGVEFSQACGRAGLRMVLGCRLKVRGTAAGELQLVALNRKGYAAISRLASEATGGEVELEQVDELQAQAGGQLWISCPIKVRHSYGGRSSALQRWMGDWELLAGRGWDNLWIELGWKNEAQRLLQRRAYAELSRRGWTRWVAMTAARHAGDEGGAKVLEAAQAIGTLTRIGQAHPDKLESGDYGLQTARAFVARFARSPQILEATRRYAEGCVFDYRYGRLFLPGWSASGRGPQADRQREDRRLRWLCLRGLVRCYGEDYPWPGRPTRKELLERLNRELGIIGETGYAGYFLVFAELIAACAERRVPVLARGSAAGSLVCYALGVGNVCPFRFDLCFERFLNPERLRHSKLPDIDLDLPWDRREEIMAWVAERYGRNKVAMIGGFAHFKGRSAVAEVAMTAGVPAHEAHAWTKRLPFGSLRKFLADPESFVEARNALEDSRFGECLELAAGLEGLPRHPMMHPCGMVIADRDLREFCPVISSAKGFPMTQLAMNPVEDLGLLKMDLLGQAGLSVLRDCIENLATEGKVDSARPFAGLNYADPAVYEMVRGGEARGVFHIESPAMTSLLRLCRCNDIDCLVATVSVIRPGAANEDKKTRFARRYLGLEQPQYAHPVLEEVLADTYGLMVYEEHILLVANRFSGMDLGTADLLRRSLIKKRDGEDFEELEAVFRSCARRLGRGEQEIEVVWKELRDFSGFMFNKAHGAAYAIEAYNGCWLKLHWPVHFLAAVLNNRRGFYAPIVYVLEILRQGGSFELPDVQRTRNRYAVLPDGDGGRLHVVAVPLWQVKGLSDGFLQRWETARGRAAFSGWADFVRRCELGRNDAVLLARVGALRGFFANRHQAVWEAGKLERERSGRRRAAATLDWTEELGPAAAGSALKPMTAAEQAAAETELLGFPVSVDPWLLWLGEQRSSPGTVPIASLEKWIGREVEIGGLQVCQRTHRTLKGELMKFISLADPSGMAETVLFPDSYRKFGWLLTQHPVARLRVQVEQDETGSGLSLNVTDAVVPQAVSTWAALA